MDAECKRAQEWISADLDGEVSPFERTLLDRHIAGCATCRVFRAEVSALTEALRAAPLELIEQPVTVSRPRRRWAGRVAPAVAAAVAVVTVGLGSLFTSLTLPGSVQSVRRPSSRLSGSIGRPVNLQRLELLRRATTAATRKAVHRGPVVPGQTPSS